MSEIPPPSYNAPPAAAAPAQRKFPTWAIVVIVLVVLCLCLACVAVFLLNSSGALSGGMAGGQLVFICADQSGLDTNACSTWVQGVTSTPEFSTCVNDLMSANNLTGDSLYQCLVDAGVGP